MAQGWLLLPWTIQVETKSSALPAKQLSVDHTYTATQLGTFDDSLTNRGAATSLPTDTGAVWRVVALSFVMAWLIGGMAMVLARVWRYTTFVRRLPLETDASDCDAPWQAEWRHVVSTVRLRNRADLRITRNLGPLVCYVPFRYWMLAPRALWERLTKPERTAILRHELAHLERRDLWKSLAIRLLALPQWFNPLVWLAVRRFDEAAEWACDDEVARVDEPSRLQLAHSLVRAAEFVSINVPAAASAQGGVLSRRIRRLVTPTVMEDGKMKMFSALLVLALLTFAQVIRVERVSAAVPQEADNPNEVIHAAVSKSDISTPQQPPAVVAIVEASAELRPIQLVAAENGATVGTALAPVARWFLPKGRTTSTLILRRPNLETDTWEELPITWDADARQPSKESNHVLKPGDFILICDKSMPESGPNMPPPSGNRTAEKAKTIFVKIARRGRPDDEGIPIAIIDLRDGPTVAGALAQVLAGSLPNPIDFQKSSIKVRRRDGGGKWISLAVQWDENNRRPTDETNHVLQPGDSVIIRDESAHAHAPAASPGPATTSEDAALEERIKESVIIRVGRVDNDNDDDGIPIAIIDPRESTTVASALAQVMTFPMQPPIEPEFSTITLRRRSAAGVRSLKVKWDEKNHRPTNETNYLLHSGDGITIRPGVQQPSTPTAPAAAILPNPVKPAPDSRGMRVLFNVMIVEDSSGSLAEFDAEFGNRSVAMADTETLRSTLRIFEKHHLIRIIARSQVQTVLGERAKIHVEAVPFELEVAAAVRDNQAKLDVVYKVIEPLENGHAERQTAIGEFEAGKSALLRMPARTVPVDGADEGKAKTQLVPMFVILTPQSN